MGLFDGIKSPSNTTMTAQQAIMVIVVGAVWSDGAISDEEFKRVRGMCSNSPVFSSNTGDQDVQVIDFAVNACAALGLDNAIGVAAASLTPELRETAFSYAMEIIVADGILGPTEKKFIEGLGERLEVSEEIARAIVTTGIIRNRAL